MASSRTLNLPSGYEKKHDLPVHAGRWQSSSRVRSWTILRKRRILIVLLALVALYFFVKNIPTDVPSVAQRIDSRTGRTQGRPPPSIPDPRSQHTQEQNAAVQQSHGQLYDGPVKFYYLATSLRPHTYAQNDPRPNILFVLRHLTTAATLMEMACDMARHNRTRVHIAVMILQDTGLQEISSITGIRSSNCPVYWHDTRPDFNGQSSLARQALVIKAALGHLHNSLRPVTVLIDEYHTKDDLFVTVLKEKLDSFWTPITVVPDDAVSSMSWITTLDAQALSLLNQIQVEIVISPHRHSAGGLIRLLESIKNAEYSGLPVPRITVELPQDVDETLLKHLENFRWPLDTVAGESRLTLRRRLNASFLTPSIAALRTAESFYPPAWPQTHVLVLSPDIELSPYYLQYLTFMMLEYKHGQKGGNINENLMGISLELPGKGLDDKSIFAADLDRTKNPLFLAQSAPSHAALYFGDRWKQYQDWISLRLQNDSDLRKRLDVGVQVSRNHPAFLSQVLELMQVKNYFMLYPGFADQSSTILARVHPEMRRSPEEFANLSDVAKHESISDTLSLDSDMLLTADQESKLLQKITSPSPSIPILPLIIRQARQKENTLPDDLDLPLFTSTGKQTTWLESQQMADRYAEEASLGLGGCKTLADREIKDNDVLASLFCDPG